MTTYLLPFAAWLGRKLKSLIRRKSEVSPAIDDLSEEEFTRRLAGLQEHIERQEAARQSESKCAHAGSEPAPALSETVVEILPEERPGPGGSDHRTAVGRQRLLLVAGRPMVH